MKKLFLITILLCNVVTFQIMSSGGSGGPAYEADQKRKAKRKAGQVSGDVKINQAKILASSETDTTPDEIFGILFRLGKETSRLTEMLLERKELISPDLNSKLQSLQVTIDFYFINPKESKQLLSDFIDAQKKVIALKEAIKTQKILPGDLVRHKSAYEIYCGLANDNEDEINKIIGGMDNYLNILKQDLNDASWRLNCLKRQLRQKDLKRNKSWLRFFDENFVADQEQVNVYKLDVIISSIFKLQLLLNEKPGNSFFLTKLEEQNEKAKKIFKDPNNILNIENVEKFLQLHQDVNKIYRAISNKKIFPSHQDNVKSVIRKIQSEMDQQFLDNNLKRPLDDQLSLETEKDSHEFYALEEASRRYYAWLRKEQAKMLLELNALQKTIIDQLKEPAV